MNSNGKFLLVERKRVRLSPISGSLLKKGKAIFRLAPTIKSHHKRQLGGDKKPEYEQAVTMYRFYHDYRMKILNYTFAYNAAFLVVAIQHITNIIGKVLIASRSCFQFFHPNLPEFVCEKEVSSMNVLENYPYTFAIFFRFKKYRSEQ